MDFAQILDSAIRHPEEDFFGFELVHDKGGEALGIVDVLSTFSRMRYASAIAVFVFRFDQWLRAAEGYADEGRFVKFKEYLDGLPDPFEGEFHGILEGRAIEGFLRNFILPDYWPFYDTPELNFNLIRAYRENPTVFQILATGASTAVVIAALAWGTVQVMREADAPACRQHVSDISQRHLDVWRKQARLEGRSTKEMAKTERYMVKATMVAASACGSALGPLSIRNMYKDFEVELTLAERSHLGDLDDGEDDLRVALDGGPNPSP